ncbi:hypothetical protein HGRIS_010462 [Hohenbuehelia grisea]|uniref:Ribonuclease H1 N-terminal domain-containing protein n=1 Tax=Hohenbuehelia grisea TaxID=104357 RepID=A0ABR3IZA3_9AGAR
MHNRAQTKLQVDGFKGNCFKGFADETSAQAAWEHAQACGAIGGNGWWVVLEGDIPGVYYGRAQTAHAVGAHRDPVIEQARSQEEALQKFCCACMEGRVST